MIFGALNINPWICHVCGLTNFINNKRCACSNQRPNTMNHSFSSSIIDSLKCKICKRPELDHGPNAECEVCSKHGDCLDVNGILMCSDCLEKETKLFPNKHENQVAYSNPDNVNPIVKLAESIKQSDARISSRPEFFNAETISIDEIRKQLEQDNTITNKRFELAKIVQQRVIDFEKSIFEADQKRFELNDRQQANRVYLQNLAAQLTSEERDKVRLKDINYPISQPKLQTPKAPSTKAKSNKEELREAAGKYGIDVSAIQTVCIARNLSVSQAIELMKKTGMIKS